MVSENYPPKHLRTRGRTVDEPRPSATALGRTAEAAGAVDQSHAAGECVTVSTKRNHRPYFFLFIQIWNSRKSSSFDCFVVCSLRNCLKSASRPLVWSARQFLSHSSAAGKRVHPGTVAARLTDFQSG